jgi:type II secretion system protein C
MAASPSLDSKPSSTTSCTGMPADGRQLGRLPGITSIVLSALIVLDAASMLRGAKAPAAVAAIGRPQRTHRPTHAAAASVVHAHLFGIYASQPSSAVPAAATDVELSGTVVVDGDPGISAAILQVAQGSPRLMKPGQSLPDGRTLNQVFKDHVVLAANGVYLTVPMTHRVAAAPVNLVMASSSSTQDDSVASASTDSEVPLTMVPPAVMRIWRGKLNARASVYGDQFGGFVLNPSVSYQRMYGLQRGDVVTRINGVALDNADAANAQLSRAATEGAASITILRNGVPQELSVDLSGNL